LIPPAIVGFSTKDEGIELTRGAGLFLVSLSATVYAADEVARGTTLKLTVNQTREDEETGDRTIVCSMFAKREQDIERSPLTAGGDPSNIYTSKEHLSVTQPFFMLKGDRLKVTNTGNATILIEGLHFSATQIAMHNAVTSDDTDLDQP
jgi:hypothetical protein